MQKFRDRLAAHHHLQSFEISLDDIQDDFGEGAVTCDSNQVFGKIAPNTYHEMKVIALKMGFTFGQPKDGTDLIKFTRNADRPL